MPRLHLVPRVDGNSVLATGNESRKMTHFHLCFGLDQLVLGSGNGPIS